MTDRKSYSDPSRDLGSSGQGKDDKSSDRDKQKDMGQKDFGSRHGDESSRGTGASSPGKGTGSDFNRER
jgi:hypothetical protein